MVVTKDNLKQASQPYHCKKDIPFCQTLRLNSVCSNNDNFDNRCNELEEWLLENVTVKKWQENRFYGLINNPERVFSKIKVRI